MTCRHPHGPFARFASSHVYTRMEALFRHPTRCLAQGPLDTSPSCWRRPLWCILTLDSLPRARPAVFFG
eukprot:2801488-Pyramimonas_sp.AAC.1